MLCARAFIQLLSSLSSLPHAVHSRNEHTFCSEIGSCSVLSPHACCAPLLLP